MGSCTCSIRVADLMARVGVVGVLLFALTSGSIHAQGFPFPTPKTRTPTRTPTATRTPTPTPSAVITPSLSPTPTPTRMPAAPGDISAELVPCVRAPYSSRLGPSAKVEVVTATGRWEIRPNPAGPTRCWLTIENPPRAVSVGESFTIRWSLGSAYEEVDVTVTPVVRATRRSL